MCQESRERCRRRRPQSLPVLCFQDSASSDSDSDRPGLLPSMLPARNSHPEIFTFDVESVQPRPTKPARRGHPGARGKRPRRVLYPAKVRRYLPAPETDRPLRWLYLLCLLVLVQICCEEEPPQEAELLLSRAGVLKGPRTDSLLRTPTAEPAGPFHNHTWEPINDLTLGWLDHQR